MIWVGGTLSTVAADEIQVQEPSGPMVGLKRLAEGATAFYRVSHGAWQQVADDEVPSRPEEPACVETLLSGPNLLALRVFLGHDCGPA